MSRKHPQTIHDEQRSSNDEGLISPRRVRPEFCGERLQIAMICWQHYFDSEIKLHNGNPQR
jgi:hypothetical protein